MPPLPPTARSLLQPSPLTPTLTLTTLPVPTPTPSTTEHLLRVHAFAICNGELHWPKNFPPADPSAKLLVPGYDLAGTVVIAPASSPFRPGDEVYARTNYARTGCARDYTIALTEELARRPKSVGWVQAAAVALSAQSAWQALFVQAGLDDGGDCAGKRVLVTGAAGGVGAWVVQLGKLAGAEVVGVCGAGNKEMVEGLGAGEVLDYRSVGLREWAGEPGKMVDVVIDCSGRKALEGAWWTVRDGGVLISVVQPPELVRPLGCRGKEVRNCFFIMQPDGAQLQRITELVDAGKCRPIVDSVWRFEDYEKAYERADGGQAKGKVVIDLMMDE
ncbi:MAG: hypothetical protein Q9195_005406 [Heterodermia aff. obscurata]